MENLEEFEFEECSICSEEITEFGAVFSSEHKKGEKRCKHQFCTQCLKRLIEYSEEKKQPLLCPNCRESFEGFVICKSSNDLYSFARYLKKDHKFLKNENLKLNESLNKFNLEKLNEIEEYKRKIKELEDFKNKHLQQTDLIKNRIKALELEIQEKEQTRLRDLEATSLKFDGQQQQILQITQNNRELVESNQAFHSKNLELQEQINQLMGKLQESKQSIQKQLSQMERIEADKRELVSKLQSIEEVTRQKLYEQSNQTRLKDNEIFSLAENIKGLNKRLLESQNKCEDYRKSYESLQQDTSNGFKRNKDLEGAISSLHIELSRSQSVIEMLNQQKKQLEKALEDSKLYQQSRGSNTFAITTPAILNTTANKISNGLGYLMGSSKQGNFNDITKPFKLFKIEEKRGSNKHTQVYKVSTGSGNNYALKLIPMNYNNGNSSSKLSSGGVGSIALSYTEKLSSFYSYYTSTSFSDQDLLAFREPMILYQLNHNSILKLESITKDEKDGKYYQVLSPFVQNDLEYVLLSNQNQIGNKILPTTLSFANIKFILYQLISAVHYLHSRDLVHRDLKPTSILLLNDNQIKLCSFGLSVSVFTSSSSIKLPNYSSSSFSYLAPELIINLIEKEKSSSSFDFPENDDDIGGKSKLDIDWKAFDMWSIGCIFLELLFKQNLFNSQLSINGSGGIFGSLKSLSLNSSSSSSTTTNSSGSLPSPNTTTTTTSTLSSTTKNLFNILTNILQFKESSPKSNLSIIKDKPLISNLFNKPAEKDFQSVYKEYLSKNNNVNNIGSSIINNQDILSKETSLPIPKDAYNLLCSLLSFNPQTRIKSNHAAFHPFFSNEPYFVPDSTSVSPNLLEDISSSLTDRNINQFIKEKCSNIIQV